jgi:hypothetical protein
VARADVIGLDEVVQKLKSQHIINITQPSLTNPQITTQIPINNDIITPTTPIEHILQNSHSEQESFHNPTLKKTWNRLHFHSLTLKKKIDNYVSRRRSIEQVSRRRSPEQFVIVGGRSTELSSLLIVTVYPTDELGK